MRQLWIHNFSIHTMRNETADMFVYSEHYAGKGPNEVISFMDFYMKKLDPNVKKLYIFSDNCFAHGKNRYIWLFYLNLIKSKTINEIMVIYPVVGHSYLDCDRDFGRIEKNRLKIEKVSLPSEWVNLIKDTEHKFNINYVNYPLTDDLKPDENPIITVKDFKTYFEKFLINSIDQFTQIRKLKFNKNGIFGSTDLLSESFDLSINLFKPDLAIEKLDFDNLKNAYENFLQLKQLKFNDVKKLLRYVIIPPNCVFYNSLSSFCSNEIVSKSKLRAYNIIDSEIILSCKCKGKCMRSCICKNDSKLCNENCFYMLDVCKNRH